MKLRLMFLAILLLTGLIGAAAPSRAAPDPTLSAHNVSRATYQGIDFLFLVDQSGSMGAYNGTRAPNDPLGLRFEAVQYMLRTLSDYRKVVPNDVVVRMATIYFGDQTPEVPMDWTSIAQGADWDQRVSGILDQLSETAFGSRDLGNTDFVSSFEKAKNVFGALPDGSEHDLKVLVVLTDGAPCVPHTFSNPNCTSQSDQNQHMQSLLTYSRENFGTPDYSLYVVAIDAENMYWPQFARDWEQVVQDPSHAIRIEASTDIGPAFLTILTDLLQRVLGSDTSSPIEVGETLGQHVTLEDTTVAGGSGNDVGSSKATLAISPYNQTLRVTIFKSAPNVTVTLTDPNGVKQEATSNFVSVTGRTDAIEVWSIAHPLPGDWVLNANAPADQIEVYIDLLRANWTFALSQDMAPPYTPVTLTLRFVDSEGVVLHPYANTPFDLAAEARVTLPNGEERIIMLNGIVTGDYIGEFTPEAPGIYRIGLHATSQDVHGGSLTVLDTPDAASLNVSTLDFVVEGFPVGDLLVSEAVELTARLVDSAGSSLAMSDVTMIAEIIARDGSPWATFPLVRQADGSFSGKIIMTDQGQYLIHVKVERSGVDNAPVLIAEESSSLFAVDPANFVLLQIISPRDGDSQYVTGGFPPTAETPVVVEVRATEANGGAPFDLVLDAGIPLLLTVTHPSESEPLIEMPLEPTNVEGLYRAEISGLDKGDYEITVAADEDVSLGDGQLFDPRTKRQSVIIHRTTNPKLILYRIALALGGIALVGTVGSTSYMIWHRRQHPVKGHLAIIVEQWSGGMSRNRIWERTLDGYKSNRITIKGKEFPPGLGIKRLLIECPSNRESQQGIAYITVIGLSGSALMRHVRFARGTERRIETGQDVGADYFLVKDPDSLDT